MKFLPFLVFLFFASGVLAQDQIGTQIPVDTARVMRYMKTPGFWISRYSAPDTLIMDRDAIDHFNDSLRHDKKLTKDIFTLIDDLKTESLLADLQNTYSDIQRHNYYTAQGMQNDQAFMEAMRKNINLSGVVVGMAPRYGLIVHFASQRFLPTNEPLYEQKNDVNFDQLQNSALDVGTPVAIVHTSADGLWYYVMSDISDGWVEAKYVAIGDKTQVMEFSGSNDFAIVIKPKADIFLDQAMTSDYDFVRMGMRLPLTATDDGRVRVDIPMKAGDGTLIVKEAYMNAQDVNTGFLPFTARTIYQQALMMLNMPYGWGDSNGEQDCSRLMQMIFATVGIELPRDSWAQAQVGSSAVAFDENSSDAAKVAAIAKAPMADTLLAMKGHILLYLGMVNGRPYAIHDTTGYKKRVGEHEVTYVINRVIISDLSLGQGSEKGSLLHRLTRIVPID